MITTLVKVAEVTCTALAGAVITGHVLTYIALWKHTSGK